eukprot:7108966-Pyramimonas_sp.AAC.1
MSAPTTTSALISSSSFWLQSSHLSDSSPLASNGCPFSASRPANFRWLVPVARSALRGAAPIDQRPPPLHYALGPYQTIIELVSVVLPAYSFDKHKATRAPPAAGVSGSGSASEATDQRLGRLLPFDLVNTDNRVGHA